MKSFFSSRVSKFNTLMTLCALGVTILGLPVTTASQEVCIKTSTGDIACGTPVPKPSSRQQQSGSNETLQTQVFGGVTFELKSCVRGTRNVVTCTLSLIAKQDSGYGIDTGHSTKLVDDGGNEYYANKLQIADKSVGTDAQLLFTVAQDAHYRITLDFINLPTSVSQITLLQINTGSGGVKFRKVPIY